MVQNIYILAGQPPRMTGEAKKDQAAVERYLSRLARALEYSFEPVEQQLGGLQQRAAEMSDRVDKIEKRLEDLINGTAAGN